MNDTQEATEFNAVPHDPAMAAADPAMFASMTRDENKILAPSDDYVVAKPRTATRAVMSVADASAAYDAYAGYSAFRRGQAEGIAEARGDGLTGHWDYTPAREMRGADEELAAGWTHCRGRSHDHLERLPRPENPRVRDRDLGSGFR